jgi:hypothetical protein
MAIPRTGTRIISVDFVDYRWLIRRKATVSQADYGSGFLSVAIELANDPGKTIVVQTDRPHPKDWATEKVLPVTPVDIKSWIIQALQMDWSPTETGAQMFFKVKGEKIERT